MPNGGCERQREPLAGSDVDRAPSGPTGASDPLSCQLKEPSSPATGRRRRRRSRRPVARASAGSRTVTLGGTARSTARSNAASPKTRRSATRAAPTATPGCGRAARGGAQCRPPDGAPRRGDRARPRSGPLSTRIDQHRLARFISRRGIGPRLGPTAPRQPIPRSDRRRKRSGTSPPAGLRRSAWQTPLGIPSGLVRPTTMCTSRTWRHWPSSRPSSTS